MAIPAGEDTAGGATTNIITAMNKRQHARRCLLSGKKMRRALPKKNGSCAARHKKTEQ
jgi:hypothetical protein